MKKPFVFKYQRSLYCAWYNERGGIGCIHPMTKSSKKGILDYRISTEALMRRVSLNRDKWEVMPNYELGYLFSFTGVCVFMYPTFYDKKETLFKNMIYIKSPENLPSFVSLMLSRLKLRKYRDFYISGIGRLYLDNSETRIHWESPSSINKACVDYTMSLLEKSEIF